MVDTVEAPPAHHGEGPVWDDAAERLLWVDLTAGEVHALHSSSGAVQTWALGRAVGLAVPRREGGLALAVREGFATLDGRGEQAMLAAPLADRPDLRMNDGACDPEGRLWAGSMAYDARPGAGALYRLDADGTLTTMLDAVTISNGIAWDPEARWMYYIDSATRSVDRFAYDRASGTISRRTRLIDVPGEPDGMTIDQDGCLWVAVWDGWQVRRYAPDGRLLETLAVPVQRPTSCAFGGPALDCLFITTSRYELDAATLAGQPLAGSLLVADVGTRGLPTPAFGG